MKDFIGKAKMKILNSPWKIPYLLFSLVICKIRSAYYSIKIDTGGGKFVVKNPFIHINIKKHKTSHLTIKGKLTILPHIGGNGPVVISLGKNSKLLINGDFIIGQGVRISLEADSTLTIGGKDKESESGITADTLVMVYKNISIGKDFVCAWNVFITDSDWHHICGQDHQADVIIDDHVWIANSNNILKGTNIGKNCIVASNSKIINKKFPDNVLIGGIPPRILKENISWKRDI